MPDPAEVIVDEIILKEIPRESRVIDLGCGDGRLLTKLRDTLNCSVLGVELDDGNFKTGLGRGLPMLNIDLDENLADIPNDSFEWAILSETLQEVRHPKRLVMEMMRIARRAIIVVPNFAQWRIRLEILKSGRTPVTSSFPFAWYDTPNLHFMSLYDFRDLVDELGLHILKEMPIIKGKAVERAWLANIRAESGFFVVERNEKPS
ncbi:MAG: methionine biosynthesis protein MetW [Planctomycetaceae bacterium]|nr:methionine biosynthesis protein MetW [Planctomycetaceae bacterium]